MKNPSGRGYALLAAAVACPAIATGMTTLFPLWVVPWTTEFGAPRATVMLIFAMAGVFSTLMMPFVGRLLLHTSSGVVIAIGAAAMGLGFIVLPWAPGFWAIAVVYALAHALGGVLAGPLPAQSFAIRRLPNAAGKVGGLMMIGLAAGGGLLPLIFAPILRSTAGELQAQSLE